jgi:hypothetical protein
LETPSSKPDPVRRWQHDIRNAMNALRLCTSAFEVCPEASERLEMLEQIELACDRLCDLVDTQPAEIEELRA